MLGWLWFVAPGELGDPASGVAVAIRETAERIAARKETLEVMLKGRCISVRINIDDIQYRIISIYLSAQPGGSFRKQSRVAAESLSLARSLSLSLATCLGYR